MTSSTESPDLVRCPPQGRLLGVDYGTKRVGLAISTGDQTIASPLEIYSRCSESQDARHFCAVISDYSVRGLVVGLPIHVNGTEGQKAREARRYGEWLQQLSQLPVEFWDERYTSAVAEEYLLAAELTRDQRKKRIDMVAAQILLQSYLNYRLPPVSDLSSTDETEQDPALRNQFPQP